MTIAYRVLFYIVATFQSFYLFFLFWDFRSFPKTVPALLLAFSYALSAAIYQYGFVRSRALLFPLPGLGQRLTSATAAAVWVALLSWATLRQSLWAACLLAVWTQQVGLGAVFHLWGRRSSHQSAATKEHWRKALARWAAFALAAVALMNAMNERWYFGAIKPDAALGIRLIANPFYGTTKDGCRGGCTLPKEVSGTRVLFLGDSSTFGLFVRPEETFAVRTIECLRSNGDSAAGVNAGVPGYNLWHMRQRYEELKGQSWDWIVVMAGYHFGRISRYSTAESGRIFSPAERNFLKVVDALDRAGLGFFRFPFLLYEAFILWGAPSEMPSDPEAFLFIIILEELEDEAASRGARTLVTLYPSAQVNADLQSRVLSSIAVRHTPSIDPRAAFDASPENLMADEVHPNAAGHAFLAEAICKTILESRKGETPNG